MFLSHFIFTKAKIKKHVNFRVPTKLSLSLSLSLTLSLSPSLSLSLSLIPFKSKQIIYDVDPRLVVVRSGNHQLTIIGAIGILSVTPQLWIWLICLESDLLRWVPGLHGLTCLFFLLVASICFDALCVFSTVASHCW